MIASKVLIDSRDGKIAMGKPALRKTTIHLAAHSIASKDAVSADIAKMAALLTCAGYDTEIFAAGIEADFSHVVRPLAEAIPQEWRPEDDILIYHHSIGWPEGERLLEAARSSVVIRYHGGTPPEFFAGVSEPHWQACLRGQEFTRILARLPGAVFWGDSPFNCDELIGYGAPVERCLVLPPLHAIEDLQAEPFDYPLLGAHRERQARIIFVGGYTPNKGHDRAIAVFGRYHELNPRSRLIFIGSMSQPFEGYVRALRTLAGDFGLHECVDFVESVSPSQLRTFYMLADAFLCLSHHERFCVPLVEAMFFRVPIVAWGTAGVSATVAGSGLVWNDFQEELFVDSLDTIMENTDLAFHLRNAGRARYDSVYAMNILEAQLTRMIAAVDAETA